VLPEEPAVAEEAVAEERLAPSAPVAPASPGRSFGAPNRANPLRPGAPRTTTPPRAFNGAEPKQAAATVAAPAPRPFSSGGNRAGSGSSSSATKLAQATAAAKAAKEDPFDIATAAFRELMKIARKRSLLGPPEVPQMTTEYVDAKPKGMQIEWIAQKLGIAPAKLQSDFCGESGWTIWPIDHFDVSDNNLEADVIEELRDHGLIPILAEQGRIKDNARTGYITVLAEHGLVAPLVLSICRKHNLDYLFCFTAIVDITELQTLLTPP
jgi:hypothetical protein